MNVRFWRSPHFFPLLFLLVLCSAYWNRVLVSDTVLLPDFLRGFAPFGADPRADWNILQWDALGQYFPWRTFAAHELHAGQIPLWNPHQFAGTPFLANGQSAVFYPLSWPFYIFDVARAFGISAWLHSLLAAFATYFLCQRWKLSRAAALLAAVAFALCGFLTFWITLPTLSNTASWLPLLVLLFERAVNETARHRVLDFLFLAVALCCAYLAGHPQIFFYCVVALFLRALTLPFSQWKRAFVVLLAALVATICGCAIQILPTLELARLGHRAGTIADANGWKIVAGNALQSSDLSSLVTPFYPAFSLSENKGYVGFAVLIFASATIVLTFVQRAKSSTRSSLSPFVFALVTTVFGLAYALATPLAQLFYFHVPTVAQMGGVGRALCLWSLGAALLAAFGLDAVRAQWKSQVVPLLALLVVIGELFAASWNAQPTAPRAAIYPQTKVTAFLQNATKNGGRVLFWTSQKQWLPRELLQRNGKMHPAGVLPPNGATVYGIDDVNGYDSLSSGAFRQFLIQGEGRQVSPQLNGNMVLLNNIESPVLNALDVRFVVVPESQQVRRATEVFRGDGCVVFQRDRVLDVAPKVPQKSGRDFFPGWTGTVYNPSSFRLGAFFSLLFLLSVSAALGHQIAKISATSAPKTP